jgi:hypothetical protein
MLENTFDYGQVYVALSRVKSLAGLWLSKPIQARTIKAHSEVLRFYSAIGGDPALASSGATAKANSKEAAAATTGTPADAASAKKWKKIDARGASSASSATSGALAAVGVARDAAGESSTAATADSTKAWKRVATVTAPAGVTTAALPIVAVSANDDKDDAPLSSTKVPKAGGAQGNAAVLTMKTPANSKRAARTVIQ